MKKFLALLMALTMVFAIAACTTEAPADPTPEEPVVTTGDPEVPEVPEVPEEDIFAKGEGVLTYAEYIAAELESAVVIEAFVQDKQSWWNDQATLYTQDKDGAYFLYNIACSEEDYAKLETGTKIKVTGFKAEWSGEVEIIDASFEILEGSYVAPAFDATVLLGTDELIAHQNELVTFNGLTVEAANDSGAAFLYSWDGSGAEGTDSDLYFNASVGGTTYTFVIEYYLRNNDTDAYKAVQGLKVGDTIDLEGFLYWYNGAQPHITAVTVK